MVIWFDIARRGDIITLNREIDRRSQYASVDFINEMFNNDSGDDDNDIPLTPPSERAHTNIMYGIMHGAVRSLDIDIVRYVANIPSDRYKIIYNTYRPTIFVNMEYENPFFEKSFYVPKPKPYFFDNVVKWLNEANFNPYVVLSAYQIAKFLISHPSDTTQSYNKNNMRILEDMIEPSIREIAKRSITSFIYARHISPAQKRRSSSIDFVLFFARNQIKQTKYDLCSFFL